MINVLPWLIFFIGVVLIAVHGLWPGQFVVDWITILILFILSIPFVARFLSKAKIFGNEFEFKEEIKETAKIVKSTVEKIQRDEVAGKTKPLPFETFRIDSAKELLDSDPVLALAALRIEIERKLRISSSILNIPEKDNLSLSYIIRNLTQINYITKEQVDALLKIINMCNKAIHGAPILKDEAKEIIDLTEHLNGTFSMGYSLDFSPNLHYESQGLLCEWEHCIEYMPLLKESSETSCPVFGHDCPGGVEKIHSCHKTIKDIPKTRFVKNNH